MVFKKGYKASEEQRRKISISKKGKSTWNKGLNKNNNIILKNLSNNMKGMKKQYVSTPEINKKISNKLKILYKDKEFKKKHIISKKARIKRSKEMLNSWNNLKFREERLKKIFNGLKMKPTKPEIYLYDIIKENNFPFNYVGDGKFIIEGYCPDFICFDKKLIIEMFGDYWHKNNQTRDEKRLLKFKKYGYKVLIIWEHELENKLNVISKIEEFIDGME